MHETYHSPKGSWETIYDNVPPLGFGMSTCQTLQHWKVYFIKFCEITTGKAKYVIGEGPNGFKLGDTLKPSPRTSTMYGRMGREK